MQQKLFLLTAIDAHNTAAVIVFLQVAFREPVIAADGYTYEKSALQEWLKQHSTSPVTGHELSHQLLTQNLAIKSLQMT